MADLRESLDPKAPATNQPNQALRLYHSRKTIMKQMIVLTLCVVLTQRCLAGQGKFNFRVPKNADPIPSYTKEEVILAAMYMVDRDIMKMTVTFFPLAQDDAKTCRLEVMQNNTWKQIAETSIIASGWTAHFRVESWDMSRDYRYRVAHGTGAFFEGVVRRNPVDQEELVVAVFTGNSNRDRSLGLRELIVKNIKIQDPDLLFFSGDQVYGKTHYYEWIFFCLQFRDIMRDRPTVCLPDDHDVGMGNLWGSSGKISRHQTDGGYTTSVEYIQETQRVQTWHLPDPYDPTPVQRGIGVYYTSYKLGRVSFALIEDRKFKTGPEEVLGFLGDKLAKRGGTVAAHIDPKMLDVPGAKLLGDRQLAFLEDWAANWRGVDLKVVLSQTTFVQENTKYREGRQIMDLDTNGWPQSGRNEALRVIRKGCALMLNGDQHLATVHQQGVDTWGDAGFSFCAPSIVNHFPRRWAPPEPGSNRKGGMVQELTGDYLDAFGNKLTMYAYVNPDNSNDKGTGYGLVRLNSRTRKITLECWPRSADVSAPTAQQYPGWPITIDQLDNYGRQAVAYLPTLVLHGTPNPVVQIIDESNGEIVYTLRIKGNRFTPKVFKKGRYTIKVGEGEAVKVLEAIETMSDGSEQELVVKL